MGVLIRSELIELAANNGLLGSNYTLDNFEPSSYDLRIGSVFKNGKIFSEQFDNTGFNNNIEIKPSEIVTILTLEEVLIPSNCIGTVFSPNSHSSTGLLILNPGHIDPGFKGPISVCAINLSNQIIRLHLKQKIFTLILETTNKKIDSPNLYQNKKNKSRKEREEHFNRENASRLSTSFFDLVSDYKETPYFRNQVEAIFNEKYFEYRNKALKYIGISGSIILFIIAVFGFMKTCSDDKNLESKIEILKIQKDSIIKIKDLSIKDISKTSFSKSQVIDSLKTIINKSNKQNIKNEKRHQ